MKHKSVPNAGKRLAVGQAEFGGSEAELLGDIGLGVLLDNSAEFVQSSFTTLNDNLERSKGLRVGAEVGAGVVEIFGNGIQSGLEGGKLVASLLKLGGSVGQLVVKLNNQRANSNDISNGNGRHNDIGFLES